MITENHIHGFDSLLHATQQVNKEGFTIEFVSNENGFFNPKSDKTYLPKNISAIEIIRLDAPFSEPDENSILYLLETVDGHKGWISDSYSIYADTNLAKHINGIKIHYSNTKNEL